MTDYLEFESKTKALKSINLYDLSVNELKEYISSLEEEIQRVRIEISKKNSSRKIKSFLKEYRKEVPFLDKDTDLYQYISKGIDFINTK